MKTVAFFIVCAIAGWSLYQNFTLLDKYVALKDKYAVALSKECKVPAPVVKEEKQVAPQVTHVYETDNRPICGVMSLPGFTVNFGECRLPTAEEKRQASCDLYGFMRGWNSDPRNRELRFSNRDMIATAEACYNGD